MANVIMKIKVMPAGVDVDLSKIESEIKKLAAENIEIKDVGIQPIAFGLKALIIAAVMPDEGNIGDEFLEGIRKINEVESVDVESVELL